jgi:hypothetical protein
VSCSTLILRRRVSAVSKDVLLGLIPLSKYPAHGQDQQNRQQDGADGQHVKFTEWPFVTLRQSWWRRRCGSGILSMLHGRISAHRDDDHNPCRQ